jgi:hypothetical protein
LCARRKAILLLFVRNRTVCRFTPRVRGVDKLVPRNLQSDEIEDFEGDIPAQLNRNLPVTPLVLSLFLICV